MLFASRVCGKHVLFATSSGVDLVDVDSGERKLQWTSPRALLTAHATLTDALVLDDSGNVRLLGVRPVTVRFNGVRLIQGWRLEETAHTTALAHLCALVAPMPLCQCRDQVRREGVDVLCDVHGDADRQLETHAAQRASLVVLAGDDAVQVLLIDDDRGGFDTALSVALAGDDSEPFEASALLAVRRGVMLPWQRVDVLLGSVDGRLRLLRLARRNQGWVVDAQIDRRIGTSSVRLHQIRGSECLLFCRLCCRFSFDTLR